MDRVDMLRFLLENEKSVTTEEVKQLRRMVGRVQRYDEVYKQENEPVEELIYHSVDLYEEVTRLDELEKQLTGYLADKKINDSLLKGRELVGLVADEHRRTRNTLKTVENTLESLRRESVRVVDN